MGLRLGFDIGGTFTDFFLIDNETGETYSHKTATTPQDLPAGVATGIDGLFDAHEVSPGDVAFLAHGTTVATNALLEGEGADPGLITTAGYRDVVAIGREDRADIFSYSPEKTPSFARRANRVTVDERISAEGEVVRPLDESSVRAAVAQLADADVDSIAIALLNAYLNDRHEREVARIARAETDLPVSLSSEVMPEIKEYERTLSTLINAHVEPVVADYIERVAADVDRRDLPSTLHLMQADGGLITPDVLASGRSLRLINSGPAGGVLGATQFAKLAGLRDLITLDMGGTSTDTSLVHEGEVTLTTDGSIGETDIPLLFPQIDITTVGAGGGSVAWVDASDRLRVGPRSAGADPGPACYGRGGTEPTVTDAALLVGYLNPDNFLGGEMALDVDAARTALGRLADTFDREVHEIAEGIIEIALATMKRAIRETSIEQGYDPRAFVLTCYGGAGPVFGARLAAELDIEEVLIPPAAGVLSAAGLVGADKQHNYSLSKPLVLSADNLGAIRECFAGLQEQADVDDATDATVRRLVDLSYADQGSYTTVELPSGPLTAEAITETRDRFDAAYEETYGYAYPDRAVEAVTWRLQRRESTPDIAPERDDRGTSLEAARRGERDVYREGNWTTYAIFDRASLPPDASMSGPAIVEAAESTVVIPPTATASTDAAGNVHIVASAAKD